MVIAIVCNYLDRQLLSILKPEILGHFNIGDIEFAWILNVFLICYAVMYPVSGILVDKFGPKPVMFGGIAAWSLACIGGGLSQDVYQFAVCRGILGLAEPTIFTGQLVAVTLWFEKRTRATANSICQAGGSIGTMCAPLAVAPDGKVFSMAGCIYHSGCRRSDNRRYLVDRVSPSASGVSCGHAWRAKGDDTQGYPFILSGGSFRHKCIVGCASHKTCQ